MLIIVAALLVLGIIITGTVGTWYGFRAFLNRAPESPRRRIVKLNPLFAILFTDELTPAGQRYRLGYLKFTGATVGLALAMVLVFMAYAVSELI
jgi:hypothetical protein